MGAMKMLVNVHEDETRIALTENNLLTDLHIQQTNRERTAGNIYRGLIVKVNPAFQAAFVDYGERKNGFLSLSDVNLSLFKGDGSKGRPRIQSVLKAGQTVMVQVLKESVGHKGAALTTFISLPGRYLVLAPNSERHGVSRKIEDSDKRSQLKEILAAIAGDDMGVIVRTAGIDRSLTELKRDLAELKKSWKDIQAKFNSMKKPGQIHQEVSSIMRVLRDYFTEAVEEVQVDSAEAYQEALQYFKAQMPKYQKRLKLYVGDKSLFSAYGVEQQIENLNSNKVPLRSGGGIVIESTEALVSVDVNSGKSNHASDIEETALHTNLEAADEVARQLRLRNLGGLVVVDFIDMMSKRNRERVVQAMSEALKADKARTTVGAISQFGLLELSRQRIDMELTRGLRVPCESCGGTGYVPTLSSRANQVLRKIRELAATGKYNEIHGSLSVAQANYILNQKRESLRDLELEFDVHVVLDGRQDLAEGHPVSLVGKTFDAEEGDEVGEAPAAQPLRGSDAQAAQPRDVDGGHRRRRRRGRRARGDEAPFADRAAAAEPTGEPDFADQDEEEFEEPLAAAAWDEDAPTDVVAKSWDEDEEEGEVEHEVLAVAKPARLPVPPAPRRAAPPARARDNGANAIVPAPKPFSLRGNSRRVFLPDLTEPISSGQAFFESRHLVVEPNSPVDLLPVSKRPDPFGKLAQGKVPGDVIFVSLHQGEQPGTIAAEEAEAAEEAGAAEAGAPADKPAARSASRRRGRGRRKTGQPAAAAQPDTTATMGRADSPAAAAIVLDAPYEDLDDARGNLILPEPAHTARGNAAPSSGKPARSRGRRGGRPRSRGGQTAAGA
ncbi:MAG: Rne/Rng family ribonuclease [Candidatus Lambdaproteobacteria bacterium]|nr:Rne/Rng family ribonuclease [Candidatus Lambdaproteobacteria bacterium]